MDLFDLFAKLALDDSEFVNGISKASDTIAAFGDFAVSGMNIAVDAVKAVGTAIIDNVSDLAQYGDSIDKTSQKMGMSIEAYQEWDAVMQHSGTSMSALKASMKTLANAADKNSEAFQQLGISEEQIASMSQEELFSATISALQEMDNEVERTALASKLLGRGATELGALLNTSAEDTQAMKDRVHELGGVLSDEAVKSSALFQDNLQDMQTAIDGIGRGLSEEFLPSLNLLMEGFTSLIISEEGADEKLTEGFNKFVEGIQNATAKIEPIVREIIPHIVDYVVETLPLMGELAFNIIDTLSTAIFDNIDRLINIGINLVKNIIKGITENLPLFITATLRIIKQLGTTITSNIGDVVEMGLKLINGIVSGILDNLPVLVNVAFEIIDNFITNLTDHLPEILDLALEIILTLVDGLTGDNLKKIADSAVTIIVKIVDVITEHLPEFVEKGFEILSKIAVGLVEQAPTIIKTAIDTITNLITQLAFNFDWVEIGNDIISGIANGITSGVSAIGDSIKQAGNQIIGDFKDFFGIASPSKLMRDLIGRFIPLGIAEGIKEEENTVEKAVKSIVDIASSVSINPDVQIPKIDDIPNVFSAASLAIKSSSIADMTAQVVKSGVSKNTDTFTASPTQSQALTININGIQYQNIDELTTAISEVLEMQTRRAGAGYGLCV